MPDVRVAGTEQLQSLAKQFRAAGDGGKLLRTRMRRNITAAVEPMKRDVQRRALAIPAKASPETGLREALARATKIRISTVGINVGVRLSVVHPLARYMEGATKWRHPVFGNTGVWVTQSSHPFFRPATKEAFPAAQAAVMAAINETLASLNQ